MKLIINDRIRDRSVEFFNNFSLDLKYNSIASSFGFVMYYNPENPEHAELVEPSHYHIAKIEHEGELLLTGYILSPKFKSSSTPSLVGVSGYSLSGTLQDCQLKNGQPLQFDNLSLKQIAEQVIEPFGLSIIIDSSVAEEMDKPYKVSKADVKDTVKKYLAELASQKNIIMTHNQYGNVVFTRIKTKTKPIMNFDGRDTAVSMSLNFDGQSMHSDITVLKQANARGGNAGESIIKNPYVPYVFRPRTVIQNSGDDNDTELAARMVLAKELSGIKLTIELDKFMVEGEVIKPNNLITVKNPELSLFQKSTWFIESVKISSDNKKDTAILTCVLPEVFNNETPKYIFRLH